MSSDLMWRPLAPTGGTLPKDLKYPLSRRLWDTDGSVGCGEASVSIADIEYLKALDDLGVDGAKELIKLIEEHGVVILWHEH